MKLRSLVLHAIRALGGFSLARYLTRDRLRILCYHGFSFADEHELYPFVFMRPQTFERRMATIKRRGIPVIPLDEAVRRLQAGRITAGEIVITFDDGWESNLTVGLPILEEYGYPACIYVTTEHLTAGGKVRDAFNMVLSYLIHRSRRPTLVLRNVHPALDGEYDVATQPFATTIALIIASEKAFGLAERYQLLGRIAAELGLALDDALSSGGFRLLTGEQMRELTQRGVDIQLHTHTHRLPDSSPQAMAPEIEQNRKVIEDVTGITPRHFCYPSGKHSPLHPEWLGRLGIVSAATCDPGLNQAGCSTMLLRRHLDHERQADIMFDAEICGVMELARKLRATLRRLRPAH